MPTGYEFRIRASLTEEEERLLAAAAGNAGLSRSRWMRAALISTLTDRDIAGGDLGRMGKELPEPNGGTVDAPGTVADYENLKLLRLRLRLGATAGHLAGEEAPASDAIRVAILRTATKKDPDHIRELARRRVPTPTRGVED